MERTQLGSELIEIYDHNKNTVICTAEILFGLENLIVLQSEGMYKRTVHDFLMERTEFPGTYEFDDVVLEALGLMNRKHLFGRMSEAKVLYAMLRHFKLNFIDDGIRVYPLQTTSICMLDLDSRYSNIYIWDAREKQEKESCI